MSSRLLVFCALTIGPKCVQAQPGDDAFVNWAKSNAKPLTHLALDAPDSAWAAIRGSVGAARVVSIGEPVHGAAEPLRIRNRMIRLLVEEGNFTAIAVESGFLEVAEVDRYLQGGEGNVDQLAQKVFSWGPDSLEQNRELLVWLRARNASGKGPKVHLYGMDAPGVSNSHFPNARLAVDFPLRVLARVAPQKAKSTSDLLDPILKRFTDQAYSQLSAAERTTLSKQIAALKRELHRHRAQLTKEFDFAIHSLSLATYLESYFPAAAKPNPTPAEIAALMETRDRAMTQSVLWARRRGGKHGKLIIYAHDFHVTNAEWFRVPQVPIRMMGVHLKRALGKQLFTVAVCAREGAFLNKSPDSGPSQTGHVLSKVGAPLFFLNLRHPQPPPAVDQWLATPRNLENNTPPLRIAVGNAFDAFVFVETLTPAKVIWAPETK